MSVREGEAEDTTIYTVVVNHEEQYSIWPQSREIPAGWTAAGVSGPKAACLSHIESVWTDMRPLSLRKAMDEASRQPLPEPEPQVSQAAEDSLPVRLSRGPQAVELALRPERTMEALVRQLEVGYVHVRFPGTRGGTELGFALDAAATEQIKTQLARGARPVEIAGTLTLDYVPVRCVARVDPDTFAGTGQLEILTA
jgi:uncharacterized protein YbdZ (MbtH family)